MKGCEKLQIR